MAYNLEIVTKKRCHSDNVKAIFSHQACPVGPHPAWTVDLEDMKNFPTFASGNKNSLQFRLLSFHE